jgi:hypothetical protein
MRRSCFVGLVSLLLAGCGGDKIAPVSGVVTLDGVPLANATVNFQPMSEGDRVDPGPGSSGKTDAEGRYRLKVIGKNTRGAVIGKHRVRITAYQGEPLPATNDRAPQYPPQVVPKRYNTDTELIREVKSGGTDKEDFELLSDAPAKGGRK